MSAKWNACIAISCLLLMAEEPGNIARMPAMWQIDSEAAGMTHEQLASEKRYLAVMHFLKEMLERALITKSEYKAAEEKVREKYHPAIGFLMTDSDLL